MLKISNVDTYGWEAAIRGMRNPMNSWDKSDSVIWEYGHFSFSIGENDLNLMRKLGFAGPDHGKFLRMITVTMDITAPLYWWKEYDTYKVGTVANSCSTMHKIHTKPFELDDFSHEHLNYSQGAALDSIDILGDIITIMNFYRERYLETKDKSDWWQLIQLLPSSYNQTRTVQANYQVLKSMYHARRNHKLDEWHTFCDEIRELPYSELITGETADV